MKALIEKDGNLSLERGGIMKLQFCPFAPEKDTIQCGDWCPLFNTSLLTINGIYFHSIELCKKEYHIAQDDFTEER